jgi:Cu(I)/Ag(I) efflux system membrane fusion protein
MNKVLYVMAALFLFACNSNEKKSQTGADEQQLVAKVASYSEAFDASFENVLNRYYALRDALVASDTAAANREAASLVQSVHDLKLDELKAIDTSNIVIPTAQTYTGSISSESEGLLGEADIENKRRAFQMISGNLFDLTRTVRYGKEKVYLLHCPMAFNDAGADWLSSTTEIKNPYFGSKMLTCGAVKDSVVLR